MRNWKLKFVLVGLFAGLAVLAGLFKGRDEIFENDSRTILAEEEEAKEKEDEKKAVKIINTNPKNNVAQKSETKTTEVKLSDTVTEKTTVTRKFDSDGDGTFDENDKHPTINDYFIVKDGNLNGIADDYEE